MSDSEDDNPFGNVQQTLRSLQFNGLNKRVCERFLDAKDIDDCIVLSDTESPIDNKVPNFDDCVIVCDNEIPKDVNKKRRVTRSDKSAELIELELSKKGKKRKKSSPGGSPCTVRVKKPAQNLQELNYLLNTIEEIGRNSRGSSTPKRGRGGRSTQSRSNRRGTKAANVTNDNTNGYSNALQNVLTQRGRGRRSTRGRRCSPRVTYDYISIGNTHEYEDELEDTPLFNSKANDVITLDDSILDENKELSVTVHWKCIEMIKFNIRKFQKITDIYKYFANIENVNENNLLFVYNDEILKPEDTPDSIGYREGRLIEGGIVNMQTEVITINDNKKEIGVKLHFQCQNKKHPFVVTVKDDERLSVAMFKCAEYMELPINQLKFEFDGDVVSGKQTAKDLELEGGECIDVKIMK